MKIYVFDLDGTLADLTHRLEYIQCKPKNWAKFFEACDKDAPISWVINLMALLWAATAESGDAVIILSGRAERVREKTETWLRTHEIQYSRLIMRKDGDFRADEVSKPELLQSYLDEHPGATVEFIIDDRQRVVDMWREKGYNVLQCNAWKE